MDEVSFVGAYRQHGARRRSRYVFGDAPQEEARESVPAVRADNDHVDAGMVRILQDGMRRRIGDCDLQPCVNGRAITAVAGQTTVLCPEGASGLSQGFNP